jgi:DNA modification methylase
VNKGGSFLNGKVELHSGDCLAMLPTLAESSIDSCVTDPPYHLTSIMKRSYGRLSTGFMGQKWDGGDVAFRPEVWREILRVLKPGAHLLAFGGTRTFHRMVCAIEDAGFEVRDTIMWVYGSGFPKSHDVSKGIDRAGGQPWSAFASLLDRLIKAAGFNYTTFDRALGIPSAGSNSCYWVRTEEFTDLYDKAEREVLAVEYRKNAPSGIVSAGRESIDVARLITAPATASALQWQGWGTALKPATENICYAQKPNVFGHDYDIIGSQISDLESSLWSMLPAKTAERNFGLSQSEFDAACASAQWSADERNNTRAALSEAMGTARFVLAITSSLNTVSSWKRTWAEGSRPESMSTTETELSTTIGLRTLKFCLSKITPASIMRAHRSGLWSIANASTAERVFDATLRRLIGILESHALGNATEQFATRSLDVGASISTSPICLARKPLSEKTVAANVLRWNCGALNIDACRVGTEDMSAQWDREWNDNTGELGKRYPQDGRERGKNVAPGRWPANLIHDGSEEVLAGFPETDGAISNGRKGVQGLYEDGIGIAGQVPSYADSGSAARFFYTTKADSDDRLGSKHPTVKPIDLIQYLIRLVTPKGGVVLDPFAGTGTTGEAAWREGTRAVLIEREEEYQSDIRRRMELALSGLDERTRQAAKARTKGKSVDPGPLFSGVSSAPESEGVDG